MPYLHLKQRCIFEGYIFLNQFVFGALGHYECPRSQGPHLKV